MNNEGGEMRCWPGRSEEARKKNQKDQRFTEKGIQFFVVVIDVVEN